MEYGYEIWYWNVRSLYRKGCMKTVSRELARILERYWMG
jgi:hypothetical protein